MEPLLSYDLITDPFPLPATAKTANTIASLTLLATNNTPNAVALQGIVLQIPIGTLPNQLTADEKGITPIYPAGWDVKPPQVSTGFVRFTFQPKTTAKLGAGQSLSFIFTGIKVNEQPGIVDIEVTEGSSQCKVPDCPVKKLPLSKFPSDWGNISFMVSPSDIDWGGNAELKWKGPAGATYTITYTDHETNKKVTIPAEGQPALSSEGVYPAAGAPKLVLKKSTKFTLNVLYSKNGISYSAQDQKEVTVSLPPSPVIKFFTASRLVIDFDKERPSVDLTWDVENAAVLEIQGHAEVTGKTTYAVKPTQTTLYALKATGYDGIHIAICTVHVQGVRDFLMSSEFTLIDNYSESYGRGHLWYHNLTEKLNFSGDGTGEYKQISNGSKAGVKYNNPDVNVSFKWKFDGEKITVTKQDVKFLVLVFRNNSLEYVEAPPTTEHTRRWTRFQHSAKGLAQRLMVIEEEVKE